MGHFVDECCAQTDREGRWLLGEEDEDDDNGDDHCFRCGSFGVRAQDCLCAPVGQRQRVPRGGVYALLYANGNVYIGKAKTDVEHRVSQHTRRNDLSSPRCTARWGSVVKRLTLLTEGTVDDLDGWEQAETLARMRHIHPPCVFLGG